MSWSANKNQKCCATCAHWSGPREVNSFKDKVTTAEPKPNAKCNLNPSVGGFAYGPKADWCCNSNYSKWSALK